MSRADNLSANDKVVQDFALNGEISAAEISAGAAQGNKWFSLRRLRLGFVANLAKNGYMVFPAWLGGLVVQWGSVDSVANEGSMALSFPLAFPNACFCGLATGSRAAAISGNNTCYFANPTQNGATLVNDGSGGSVMGAFWLALGN